jgi:hypothetical protein
MNYVFSLVMEVCISNMIIFKNKMNAVLCMEKKKDIEKELGCCERYLIFFFIIQLQQGEGNSNCGSGL